MDIENNHLKKIYEEISKDLNLVFYDLSEKLADEENFILNFDKRNLEELKKHCYSVSFNPNKIFKEFYFEKTDSINRFFKNLLNLEDIYSKMDYETGILTITAKYNEKEILIINIIEKEYYPLIPIDKEMKIVELKKEISTISCNITKQTKILLDDKLIKELYSIKKIKAFNKNAIKTIEDAKKDISEKINALSLKIEEIEEEINKISLTKDEYQIKMEEIIKNLNSIDYNLILSKK